MNHYIYIYKALRNVLPRRQVPSSMCHVSTYFVRKILFLKPYKNFWAPRRIDCMPEVSKPTKYLFKFKYSYRLHVQDKKEWDKCHDPEPAAAARPWGAWNWDLSNNYISPMIRVCEDDNFNTLWIFLRKLTWRCNSDSMTIGFCVTLDR